MESLCEQFGRDRIIIKERHHSLNIQIQQKEYYQLSFQDTKYKIKIYEDAKSISFGNDLLEDFMSQENYDANKELTFNPFTSQLNQQSEFIKEIRSIKRKKNEEEKRQINQNLLEEDLNQSRQAQSINKKCINKLRINKQNPFLLREPQQGKKIKIKYKQLISQIDADLRAKQTG